MACFTNGTLICTLKGEMPVGELSVGDRVVTRDNGLQTVRRISRRTYDYGQLAVAKHLRPILMTVGALGKGLPEQDMLLSPNQRVIVSADRLPGSGAQHGEGLLAVKHLVDNHTVRNCTVLGVQYVHIEFARHEVVLANGIWAESFHSEDAALGAEGNAQRSELFEIFPERKLDVRSGRGTVADAQGTAKLRQATDGQVGQ